jgi:hypothetical protein
MENAMIIREKKPSTASDILKQVRLIQEVMEAVMKKDIHYGIIPGTPKPTLYKPGAEKLLSTFHIGVNPSEHIVDLSTEDEIRYRVGVEGFNNDTGALLGVGWGECSSSEEKYKWKKPICDEEFDETPTDRKRITWKRGDKGPYQQKQIRMNPVDVANTILKMAKKRALIDMTLTITAASDIFDQDIEDLPEGLEVGQNGKPTIKEPQKKASQKPPEGIPAVTAKIKEITKTSGKKKDGSDWTLFVIHTEDGEKYGTFSKSMADAAMKFLADKKIVDIVFEATDKGKDLKEIMEHVDADPNPE